MAKPKKRAAPTPSPNGAAKGTCFTIMPFGQPFDTYYERIYKPAIKAAGLEPHRVDDLFAPSHIVGDIWRYTTGAAVLLGDLTGKNANVFYELGLAHAIQKPVVMVAATIDDVPFDLRGLRVQVYDKNVPDWGARLEKAITSSLLEVLANPNIAVPPPFLKVKAEQSAPVSPHEKELLEIKGRLDALERSALSDWPISVVPAVGVASFTTPVTTQRHQTAKARIVAPQDSVEAVEPSIGEGDESLPGV
jgi:hypothetical protein